MGVTNISPSALYELESKDLCGWLDLETRILLKPVLIQYSDVRFYYVLPAATNKVRVGEHMFTAQKLAE